MNHSGATAEQAEVEFWIARLKQAAQTGQPIDLAPETADEQVCPGDSADWPAERVIPGAALRAVLTDPDLRVDPHGLHIRAARFTDRLDLESIDFPHHLQLTCCCLSGGLHADSAKFGQLGMNFAHVEGQVHAVRVSIDGALNLFKARLNNPNKLALVLDGATIGGRIVADRLEAWGAVRAVAASTGQLALVNAQLTNPDGDALFLDGATISGGLVASGLRAWGQVRAGASIVGQLILRQAQLTNPDKDALNMGGAKISADLVIDEVHVWGSVRALGADIDGVLLLSKTELDNSDGDALNLDRAKIGGDVIADELLTFGEIHAVGASIAGQLDLSQAQLVNPNNVALTLDETKIGGSLRAVELQAWGAVRAVGASVNGQLNLEEAQISNPDTAAGALNLDAGNIGQGLFSRQLRAWGEVHALGAGINGGLWLGNAQLTNPDSEALSLDGAKISGGLLAVEMRAWGQVRLIGARVDGQLDLWNAQLSNPKGYARALHLQGAQVAELLLFPSTFDGVLDLSASRIDVLRTADTPPQPLVAPGWEVGDIHGPLRNDWRLAHRWLQSGRSAGIDEGGKAVAVQPWQALAAVYDRAGDPASAKRLRVAAAQQVTRQSPPLTKAARWIYFLVAGNGYYPLLAFVWMVLIIGMAVGIIAVNREDIVPTDAAAANTAVAQHFGIDPGAPGARPADKVEGFLPVTAETPCTIHPSYPCMNSWVFALNEVLPPAASTNRDWVIAADATLALTAGLPVLKLLSWALTALLLTGVTGLLRTS